MVTKHILQKMVWTNYPKPCPGNKTATRKQSLLKPYPTERNLTWIPLISNFP